VRLNPQAEAGYIARGSAYAKEGELDRAIADFDHAKQLNPNDKNVYLGRGRVFLDRGDVDSAIAECDRAIQIDPKDGRAYLYRGHAFADRGDFRSAVADYDRAIQLDPKNALLYRARSISGLYAGLLFQAQTDIDQSRALDPKDSYAALWLDILAKRGKRAEPTRQGGATTRYGQMAGPDHPPCSRRNDPPKRRSRPPTIPMPRGRKVRSAKRIFYIGPNWPCSKVRRKKPRGYSSLR